MNIMENKRVTAITAVMAVVFAGLCYKGYQGYSSLKTAQREIASINDQLDDYRNKNLKPTKANEQQVQLAAKEVEDLLTSLNKDLEKYTSYCVKGASGDDALRFVPGVKPVEFQNRLRALSTKFTQEAAGKTQLHNAAGDFGMTSMKTLTPTEVTAPYYNFLLDAVHGAMRHIIDAGAPSIDRVYCAPLPEEKITAVKKDAYFPLSFEIAFTAKKSEVIQEGKADTYSVIPQVINKLSQDPNIFYIITGVAVNTLQPPPTPEAAPSDAPKEAGALDEDAPVADKTSDRIASLIVGRPEEQVSVHITVQVLYFTTDKL